LEGWDRDWQDVGNRRQGVLCNFLAGNYRFRVSACNNSGVLERSRSFVDFSVAPAYYQTSGSVCRAWRHFWHRSCAHQLRLRQ